MATIKLAAPLAGLRGTIGGVVYSENKGGPYAKIWNQTANPRTSKQTIERGFLSKMPTLWNSLTAGEKADWDTFAALGAQELFNSLGESYYASGFNWFCKCNLRLCRAGRSTITTKPTQARPAAPNIDCFRVTVSGSETDLATGGVATASTETVGFEASHGFDDSIALADRWQSLAPNNTGWLQYVMPAAHIIKRYRIYIHNHLSTKNPVDWTFEVKNNGGFDVIHTVTGFSPTATGWYDFRCCNTISTDTYRINITQNSGDPNEVYIVEMEYYKDDEDGSTICYPEDDFADTPDYDLILHIAMGASIGNQVMYPGFYEILAKQNPNRWAEAFQAELEAVFGTIIDKRSWFARLARQTSQGIRSTWKTERTETV